MIAEEDLGRLHEAALFLLRELGCIVSDVEALALLRANGATVDGELVRLHEPLVAKALATVPAEYTVAGRRPELDLRVAPDAPPVLSGAFGPAFVLDAGEQRPSTLSDLRAAIALGHVSPNISVHGLYVEALDVPAHRRTRMGAHAYVTGSDKPCMVPAASLAELQVATDVLEILHGAEWHARPRLLSNINSTSPLQL